MIFKNREQAARLLAGRMHHLRGTNPLILAIPRGAVPMGRMLADSLGGELDVALVRKLGFPNNPEVALGAVDETGNVFVNEFLADYGITDEYIQRERERQMTMIQSRRQLYTPLRPNINPKGKTVIVLDDGVASGFTMITALHAARRMEPGRLVAAAAVASPDAVRRIDDAADEAVFLHVPAHFSAVSEFFEDFAPVTDEDVIHTLTQDSLLL